MQIAILGAGGVGGYFGGRLAQAGSDVTFVARGAHLAAIREKGLRIVSPAGDATIRNATAVETIAQAGAVDLVMIAVKLWDTEAVARELAPIAAQGAALLSLQNGVQKDDILRRFAPADSVIGGVSYISAVIAEPGVIRHVGGLQALKFGEYGGRRTPRVEALFADCRKAGVDAEIVDDPARAIWEKFVFLVGFSATTATMRQPIGAIRANPQSRSFLLDVMREAVAVGRASGVALREDFAEDRLAFCDTLPADLTASMAVDLERGNRLKSPWLSGAVVDYGKRFGVPTPCNRAVADILAVVAEGHPRT